MDRFSVTAIVNIEPKIVKEYEFDAIERDGAKRQAASLLLKEVPLPFTATEILLHPLIRFLVKNLTRDARKTHRWDVVEVVNFEDLSTEEQADIQAQETEDFQNRFGILSSRQAREEMD